METAESAQQPAGPLAIPDPLDPTLRAMIRALALDQEIMVSQQAEIARLRALVREHEDRLQQLRAESGEAVVRLRDSGRSA